MNLPRTRKQWLQFFGLWAASVVMLYAGLTAARWVAPYLAAAMAAGLGVN